MAYPGMRSFFKKMGSSAARYAPLPREPTNAHACTQRRRIIDQDDGLRLHPEEWPTHRPAILISRLLSHPRIVSHDFVKFAESFHCEGLRCVTREELPEKMAQVRAIGAIDTKAAGLTIAVSAAHSVRVANGRSGLCRQLLASEKRPSASSNATRTSTPCRWCRPEPSSTR